MTQIWKNLIFTGTFLAISTFSAQAMEDEITCIHADEKTRVHAFCKKYKCDETFEGNVYKSVKGEAFQLNHYGVTHLHYKAAFLYYSKWRTPGYFQLLYDLFTMMPLEKREDAFSYLNACPALYSGRTLAEFYIEPDGEEACSEEDTLKKMISSQIITEDELGKLIVNIVKEERLSVIWHQADIFKKAFDHLQKEKGIKIISLEEKLLALPYEPYQM